MSYVFSYPKLLDNWYKYKSPYKTGAFISVLSNGISNYNRRARQFFSIVISILVLMDISALG